MSRNAADWAREQDRPFESTTFNVPEGYEIWKFPSEGKYILDVIPYICGKGNPQCEEGLVYWERAYEVHQIRTPNGENRKYCCTYACFGKKCACCDFVREKGGTADPDLIKELRSKTRRLLNIRDPKNPKKKYIWDTVHWGNQGSGFGQQLKEAILTDEDKYGEFYSLKGGYSLRLIVKEKSWPGAKTAWLTPTRVDFVERPNDLPESFLKGAACLDDLLIKTPYDSMMNLLEGGGSDEDENDDDDDKETVTSGYGKDDDDDDERPAKKKVSKKDDDDDDIEEDEDDEEVDDDDDNDEDLDEDDKDEDEYDQEEVDEEPEDDDDDDDDEDNPPPKKGKKKPVKDEDEDDDDDEDEDDEEPAPKKKKAPVSKAAKDLSKASDFGIQLHTVVKYKGAYCYVKTISGDETSLSLYDVKTKEQHNGVAPDEVTVTNKKVDRSGKLVDPKKPAKTSSKKSRKDDDDDDD